MILKNLTKFASCLMQNPNYYMQDMGLLGANNNRVTFYSNYDYSTPKNGGINFNKVTTGGSRLTQEATWYITLGSGTTQPTFNDYCLESEIANKSSIKYTSTNATFVNNSSKLIFSAVINNTGTEAITFTEVMLNYYFGFINGGSSTTIALTRDVISPTVIPAGTSKNITVIIDFSAMATSVA